MKLPQVIYSNPVEGQGRYKSKAPQIIEKTGAVLGQGITRAGKIEASGIRQAGQILGQSISSAGAKLAKGTYQAEKMANDARARDIFNREKIRIDSNLRNEQAIIRGVSSVAQTMLTVGAKWYAAEQKAKQDKAFTDAKVKMGGLLSSIGSNSRINTSDPLYSEFSTSYQGDIENMIGPDGQTYTMAPTHKVSGEYFDQGYQKIKDEALNQITGGADREELATALDSLYGEMSMKLSEVNAKYEKQYLGAMYMESIDKAVRDGDYPLAHQNLQSGYAIGALSDKFYTAKKADLLDTEKGDSFFDQIDNLRVVDGKVPETEISKLRTEITKSNISSESSLRTALRVKENELQAMEKEAEREMEKRNINAWYTSNVGKFIDMDGNAQEGLTSFTEAAKQAGFGENLTELRSMFRTESNYIRGAESRRLDEVNSGAWDKITDPNEMPTYNDIPATATGKDRKSMRDYIDSRQQGREVRLDVNRWNEIQDMLDSPEGRDQFKQMNLTEEAGRIPQGHLDQLRETQRKLTSGNPADLTEMQTFKGEMDDQLFQIFGKGEGQLTPKEMEEAIGLKIMAQSVLAEFERSTGKKADPMQRQMILNDLFKSQIKINYKNWRGKGSTEMVEGMRGTKIDTNAFKVISQLRSEGLPVSRETIVQKYNEMVLNGQIQ